MPTDEERREVAARLREIPSLKSEPVNWPALMGALGAGTREDALVRLAELIEPEERTCRMIDNGVELCCSVCDRRHGYDDEPDFCMGCGAKVTADA